MSLYEQLMETWPQEVVEPYHKVLLIPNRLFKPEWEKQLTLEGCKVYMNTHKGEKYAFIKLPDEKEQSQNIIEPSTEEPKADVEVSSLKFRRRRWTAEDDSMLRQLYSQHLDMEEIAEKMNRTKNTIRYEISKRLKLTFEPETPIEGENVETKAPVNEDSVVKELLSACSMLYPTHKHACALLLRAASVEVEKP